MVAFNMGNMLKMPQILKIPELGLCFITLMIARLANPDEVLNLTGLAYGTGADADYFGKLVVFGFFFIVMVQIVSILMGDRSPVQDFLFALTGFVFFMAVGANVIDATRKVTGLNHAAYNGFGSMCIITSFVFLVDVVFSALNLKKD